MTNPENHDEATNRERRLRKAAQRQDLDADALERAHEDAQFTMEQTLQLFSDLSDEAFRPVRLNAVVLTILIASASQVEVESYVNVFSVAAVFLFVGSALFALGGYLITTVHRGIDTETFDRLTAYKLREEEYLNWILTLGYPEWIESGVAKVDRKEQWLRRSLVALLAGLRRFSSESFLRFTDNRNP